MRYHSGFGLGNSGERRGHEWAKHGDIIARRMKDDHGELSTGEILLMFEIAVNSEQNVN